LGVEVDLPVLAQRVALAEMPLVVHEEPLLARLLLQVGNEARDVDDRHQTGRFRSGVPAIRPPLHCISTTRPPPGPRPLATRRPGYGTRGPGARPGASPRPTSRRRCDRRPPPGRTPGRTRILPNPAGRSRS